MDQVVADHDEKIVDMKAKVEGMWDNCGTQWHRRSVACAGVPGLSFCGDNIGQSSHCECVVWNNTFYRESCQSKAQHRTRAQRRIPSHGSSYCSREQGPIFTLQVRNHGAFPAFLHFLLLNSGRQMSLCTIWPITAEILLTLSLCGGRHSILTRFESN